MFDLKFLKTGLLFAFGITPIASIPFLRKNVEKTQNEVSQVQALSEAPKEAKKISKLETGELKRVVLTDAKGVKRVLVGKVTKTTVTNSAGKKIKQVKVAVKKKKSKPKKRK